MILAAIVLLFFLALVIYVLTRWVSRPGYAWFVAVGGALVAWVLVLLSNPQQPTTFPLMDWTWEPLFFASPTLLLDTFSWPFVMAISTLLVAVLLTDVARVDDIQPSSWSVSLALTSFGMVSILSANLLTLAMTWTVLDVIEIISRFQLATNDRQRVNIIVSFSGRIIGSLLMIPAILIASSKGDQLNFSMIPTQVAGFLILAAGLRLGVVPLQAPFLQEIPIRRGLGTMTRLVPVAASIVLLTRVAAVGTPPDWSLALIIASATAVLYGSLAWVWAPNELDGRPFWILSLSAFVIVATVRAQPLASQTWGLSLLFSGGMLFLYSARDSKVEWIFLLGVLGFTALPFTPAWLGLSIFSTGNLIFWAIFILGLAALVLGYFRHLRRPEEPKSDLERWVWGIYPVGLALLPLTHWFVIWNLGGIAVPPGGVLVLKWWSGLFVFVLIGIILFSYFRGGYSWSPEARRGFGTAVSLEWLYRTSWWVYRTLGMIINYFFRILEGDGGVLWAILILILLTVFYVGSVNGI